MNKLTMVLAGGLVLGLTLGCGGPKEKKVEKIVEPTETSTVTGENGEPQWVSRGGGIYEGEYGKAIYAVGSARQAPAHHIMQSQARTRARTELSRILSVTVRSMTKDFTETAGDLYDKETQSAIEYFQDVSQQITNNTLVGSEQVATWKAGDGTLFVLMKISLDNVINTFKTETKAALKREDAAKKIGFKAEDAVDKMNELIDKTADGYTNKPVSEIPKE
ncbi:MAG: LPP20 family lipoprotein [Planctomycetota bacterium]